MPGVRLVQAFWTDESTPGTVIAVDGTTALRVPAEIAPPEPQGGPINRNLTHANADYGRSIGPVARHYSGSLPPLHVAYWDESATAPEHGAIIQAMGYSEAIVVSTSATYESLAAPNLTANLASGSLYLEEGPAGDGHQYIVFGTRARGTFRFGADAPHLLEVEYMGGFGGSGMADLGALTSPTYYTDGIASTIGTFSLNDGSPYTTVLILRSGFIRTPYTPTARPSGADSTGEGYALPPYMAPGQVEVELVLELVDQAVLPIQSWLDNQTDVDMVVEYSDGGDTINHTVRNMQLQSVSPDSGPPMTVTLGFVASSDASNAAHTIVYA